MGRAATAPAHRPPLAPPTHVPRRRSPVAPPTRVPQPRPAPGPRRSPGAPVPRGAAVLDALLHGRAWIAIVFVSLAGIVFFNVDLLRMNREIAGTAERARLVKLENGRLRTDVARLGSSERIQRVAAQRGLVLPAPGEVRYLRSDPVVDARRAAARIKASEAGEASAGQAVVQPQGQAAVQPQGQAAVQPQE